MVRVVGHQDRSEIILDPVLAWKRGRALDRMLVSTALPIALGVSRLTHREMNRLDDARQLQAARRLNPG